MPQIPVSGDDGRHTPAPGHPLRVGLVCGWYDPRRDGVSHYTRNLAAALGAQGIEATVIAGSRTPGDSEADRIGTNWRLWDLPWVIHQLRRRQVDIVHVQFAPSAYRYRPGTGLIPDGLRSIPIVVTLHEYGWWQWPHWMPSMLLSPLERRGWWDRETLRLVTEAQALVVTNGNHAEALRQRLPNHPPVRIVPIGANITSWPDPLDPGPTTGDAIDERGEARSEGQADRLGARTRVGVPQDAPLVVFFGFIHPVKGIRTLIEAVERLSRTRPDLRLTLVGGIESLALQGGEADSWHAEVVAMGRSAGMGERLTITGWVSDDQVSMWLHAADVVALPFTAGLTTKSGSLLAALAHDAPVVGTTADPPDHELEESGATRLVPPRDPVALAEAIDCVLASPLEARKLRHGGRSLLANRSWPSIAAAHAELYRELVPSPWSRPRT